MSMHKIPLTDIEREGLHNHGLPIGTPNQLSDVFRHGVKWAQANMENSALNGSNTGKFSNPNNCSTCEHKQYPYGDGWCYMYREQVKVVCMSHTGRKKNGVVPFTFDNIR